MVKPRLRTATLGAGIFLFSALARAGTFTAWPPHDFVRDTAQPTPVVQTFTVKNPAVPYRLRLLNGGATGALEQVTSAVIKVNGTEVIGTNDFSGHAPNPLEKPVTLAASNEISVELRGNPGSGATLSILGEDTDQPLITATIDPPANAAGWNRDNVTVTFTCSDATTEISSCTAPVVVTAEGPNQVVTGTAVDGAGNTATTSVTLKIDKTAPAAEVTAPAQNTYVHSSSLEIVGTVLESGSGLSSVTCNDQAATVTGTQFRCQVLLTQGVNFLTIRARDVAENESGTIVGVTLDTVAPALTISRPEAGSTTNAASIPVVGVATDEDQIASVTVNGNPVASAAGEFTTTVNLVEGANPIAVTATDRAGNVTARNLTVTRFTVPTIAITTPADLAIVATPTTTVSGTTTDAASVTVNGVAASLSGNNFTAAGVPLAQGRTVVTATARSAGGHLASQSILVYRDAIPPNVIVDFPAEGTVVYQNAINVSGSVDDIVVGTINPTQARVTVNGVQADVSNRAFLARNIGLAPGANTILVTAQDQGGNTATATVHVTYNATAQAKIGIVSGNNQTAPIVTELPQALTVRLTSAAGAPAPNQPVTFRVVENNGTLKVGTTIARYVTAVSDANGVASAIWTIGSHSGAGNQVVEATAAGYAGTARFEATGLPDVPGFVVVDSGGNQFGIVGSPLPRPLIAVVTDAGSNRLGSVPVQFTVSQGGGHFANGQTSIVVNTDSDGRAIVTPFLGPEAGANVFNAGILGVRSTAGFQATARVAGAPENTAVSGVVMDNTDAPIAGVTVRIEGTTLTARTSATGQFTIPGAPVGYVKLLVDGSTAQRTGTWPTLEFAMYTLPGQDNTLGMPIYLLPIDIHRGLYVDEVTGGTLTLPELPGFSLTIRPGSVTFPGGLRTGTVSVTLVHSDKMPMPPGFGQQPRFIVTIQPVGAHFDPPAAITFPNVDGLAPGEVTELYSFDHDLGQFVAIGNGSVSDDGTVLRSDPGVGIIKAGWHCGGNPSGSGTASHCPTCQKCVNNCCVPDPAANPAQCCKGQPFSNATQCCEANGPIPKKPIANLADCPRRTADPAHTPSANGCTGVPDNPNIVSGTGSTICAAFGQAPSFLGPCNFHDICYDTCNNPKATCDTGFRDRMLALCAPLSNSQCRSNCQNNAQTYYGVVAWVDRFYDAAQKAACKCCP